MQAITLEVILRAVFGVSDPHRRARLHDAARASCSARPPRPACRSRCCSGAAGRSRSCARWRATSTTVLLAGGRRAPPAPGDGHLLAARPGELRGRHGDGRRRDPRPADDAAGRRPRDDRHRPRVDARPAHPPPGRAGRGRAPGGETVPARGRRRVAAPAPGRPARRPPPRRRPRGRRPAPPRGHRRHAAIWLAHTRPEEYPRALRVQARALPRQAALDLHLDPVRRRRAALHRRAVRGTRDADRARGGAHALRPAAAGRQPEGIARRNVTFSPRHGTRIVASRRT